MGLEEKTSKLALDDKVPSDDKEASGTPPPAKESADTTATPTSASKPKRVRTGCLTCRERHLKCDEGMPVCQNCKRSSRTCKRGVRLNFIDTKVEDTQLVPQSGDWSISFQDESRDIASEYKGGISRYAVLEADEMDGVKLSTTAQPPQTQLQAEAQAQGQAVMNVLNAPVMSHQPLPPMQSPLGQSSYSNGQSSDERRGSTVSSISVYSNQSLYAPDQGYQVQQQPVTPSNEARDCLTNPEETLFMQVFVEEVGLWMDSMDPHKHFSRILPFYALAEPMLLNAFLACGARHLSLVNPAFHEDKALHYYDTATRELLRSLQNPNRDTIICATAAVILNVYEVMTEKALQRMNHIAGARALIKECGWSARSTGIGAACFWLNVGMELLSCLHFNWQVAWNPDDWGLDMNMEKDTRAGNEELWTYKILHISARVCNFRATIPRFQEANPTAQAMRQRERTQSWEKLKEMCDTWNECIPRTMHPAAYLLSHHSTKSIFPEVWIIKRTSIMARLFYHTAMCLLPQMHPVVGPEDSQMFETKTHHAHMICGIVAHVKDRGVASAAIRCVGVAAECLSDFREQTEILNILKKIKKETGWRIDFIEPELRKKWGWTDEYVRQMQQAHGMAMDYTYQSSPPISHASTNSSPNTQPQRLPAIPQGIVNPTMRMADFNQSQHAYQNYWVAPSHQPNSDIHYLNRLTEPTFH